MQQLEGPQLGAVTLVTQLCAPPHAGQADRVPHAGVDTSVCSRSSSQRELGRHVTNRESELQETDFRGVCSLAQLGPSSTLPNACCSCGSPQHWANFSAALRAVGTVKDAAGKSFSKVCAGRRASTENGAFRVKNKRGASPEGTRSAAAWPLVSASMLWILYCVLWTAWPAHRTSIFAQWQQDALRSPLARSKGYPVEEHVTTTEDGYVLSLQRVGGRLLPPLGPPVLLVHGLLSSAAEWVINYPHQSLAFLLADAGYDVWLGNCRGTPYSRGHLEHSDSDGRYWDFRLDEVGLFDLPALVDYVLERTGWPQLFLVGFSQGNTAAWAMLADKPQYNRKVSN
ncbi:hypothetical protein HPB50_004399 [Hyalomma asiaticum]|uniref:Uncharacterized protein n=1 Tax=Hyalomma asiaticum TaxID=266040 RepID=A0ACB7RQD8_HYAAI|nr:hypothetical protein HPB50_004399 [Hyalomma asiaticum]